MPGSVEGKKNSRDALNAPTRLKGAGHGFDGDLFCLVQDSSSQGSSDPEADAILHVLHG
jgi:hypothetical protein